MYFENRSNFPSSGGICDRRVWSPWAPKSNLDRIVCIKFASLQKNLGKEKKYLSKDSVKPHQIPYKLFFIRNYIFDPTTFQKLIGLAKTYVIQTEFVYKYDVIWLWQVVISKINDFIFNCDACQSASKDFFALMSD